ncbi:ABC transporter ATP-binding protein [Ruminococcus albus]|uniref:ABC transporter related protein n=1 Tax=Ruminococcus albus (strain ATCC 27210 / DSM 20455 / JCM 14654 / NCDO 2250 / 7) TaxID=697329 RepID=E6UAY2_RUMA7|nr:ABC transporter ATP-binding protein [Ruminococcus albus]ADU22528.1 ABC transporter related protein [Ruminococcus albus 7 = DSM 20455]
MFTTLKRFFDFCDEEDRKKLYVAIGLGTIKAIFAALRISAIGVVVMGILDGDMTYKTIWAAVAILAASVLGQLFINLKTTMLQTEAGYHSCANKRIEIAEHLRYLPMGYFNDNSLGHITSVTTNTMEALSDVATRVVMLTTQGILTTIVITAFVFCFDWRIGFILTIGVVIYALVNAAMQKATRKGAPAQQKANRELVAAVIEFIQGIAEVKNYNLVSNRAKKLEAAIKAKQNGDTHLEFDVIPYITLQEIVIKLIGVVMCAASVYFYIGGSMSLLYCIMMMISSFMIYESLDVMAGFSSLIRTVDICVSQAKDILTIPEMDIEGSDITPVNHDIELKNVTFAYENRMIINGVDLKIPEHTTTAIVGPSGGGKTTMTSLMARFWNVKSGEVLLGGKNVKEYSFDSLMRNFSFVFQRVYLFEDTIANNIRFGDPDAPMEKVIEAAKKARCHDFIMNLPDGYETVIGEGGASLSGGEKQRISIARAIMKDSPIIILDEATANVDPENEAELTKAIEELTKEKTIIMIAHRLKTVEHADQIIVIDGGKIVQQGKHNVLMQKDGIYRTFVTDRQKAASWKL